MIRETPDSHGRLPNGIPERDDSGGYSPPPTWTSISQGEIIPAVWGTCRVPSVALYRGTLRNELVKDSLDSDATRDGVGAPAILGIALGPVASIATVYKDKESGPTDLTHFARIVSQYGNQHALLLGDGTEPAPSYITPAIGYRGVAQFRTNGLSLSGNGDIPSLSWEVKGWRTGPTDTDAAPGDVALDLCTLDSVGMKLLASQVQTATGLDGLATSSYVKWCVVNNFRVSGYASKHTAKEALEDLARSTFATIIFSEGKVKLVPLGTAAVDGYVPPTPVALSVDDFGDSFEIERIPESEVFNTFTVRFENRDAKYTSMVVQYQDAAHAAKYGVRRAEEIKAPWLKTPDRAHRLAQMYCKASIYQRLRAHFTLSPRWSLLEAGDLVRPTHPLLFPSGKTFRLTKMDLVEGGFLRCEALESADQASATLALTPQPAAPSPSINWNAGGAAQTAAQNAQTTANAAAADAAGAKTAADAAAAAAGAAQTAAGNAQNTANTAQATADTAKGDAGYALTEAQRRALTDLSNVPDKTIVLGKLAVLPGGSTLNPDPNFEDAGRWEWEVKAGTFVDVADAKVGKRVVRGGTPISYLHEKDFYPVDPTKRYRARFWARSQGGANGILYFCLRQWQDKGVTSCALNSGRNPYKPAGVTVPTTWTEYSFEWGPAEWQAGMKYVQPDWLLNYNGTAGYMEVNHFRFEEMTPADLIVDGSISTSKCTGDVFQTSNYTGSGTGDAEYAVYGAKMRQNATGQVPSLLVDSAGFKVGQNVFRPYLFRLINGLDGRPNVDGGSDAVWYRGNCDPAVNSGRPNIDRITAFWCDTLAGASETYFMTFSFTIQPAAASDNLDSLRAVRVVAGYNGRDNFSAYGTNTRYIPISDRAYGYPATTTDSRNASTYTFQMQLRQAAIRYINAAPFAPDFQVRMYLSLVNAYGISEERFFNNSTGANVLGPANLWARSTDTVNSPPPPASGGGDGGGGGCPSPWMLIRLADGTFIKAGDLQDGMEVMGLDERDLNTPMVGTIRFVQPIQAKKVRITVADGSTLDFSFNHRLGVAGKGWVAVQDVKPGDLLVSEVETVVKSVEPIDDGTVITFKVDGPGTYFADGVLCHNAKKF